MSLSGTEIPRSVQPDRGSRRGTEALPKVTKLNKGLYTLVFCFLGLAMLLLIIGWMVLATLGKAIPDGLPVVIATIVGALAGVVTADSRADSKSGGE